MITLVVGYFFLKLSGICCCTLARVGHNGISLNLKYKKFTHVIIIRETVEGCIQNRSAKSSSNNPTLKRQSVMKKNPLLWETVYAVAHTSILSDSLQHSAIPSNVMN